MTQPISEFSGDEFVSVTVDLETGKTGKFFNISVDQDTEVPPEGHHLMKYNRIPFEISAYRLSLDNFDAVKAWCGGNKLTITKAATVPQTDEVRLEVPVWHPSAGQSGNARVGDWVTKTPKGFKIYTNRAFRLTFAPAK